MNSVMTRGLRAATIAASGLLAACSSGGNDGPTLGGAARDAARQLAQGGFGRAAAPAPAPDPQAMAAEAMKVNPGPLILVGMEGLGTTQVLAMTGENQGKRTYMTESMQAFIVRDGMVLGTRGLGNDLSVAEPGTEALIRNRQAGTATRIMRVLEGDGLEHGTAFTCTVTPEASRVRETCSAGALTFENTYIVGAGGSIPVSRQWLSQRLGYATIQVIRP